MNSRGKKKFIDLEDLENLEGIIKEIKENTYDYELEDIYVIELLDQNKEYE